MLKKAFGIGNCFASNSTGLRLTQKFCSQLLVREYSSNAATVDDNCYTLLDSKNYQTIDTILDWKCEGFHMEPDDDLNYYVHFCSSGKLRNGIHYWAVEFDNDCDWEGDIEVGVQRRCSQDGSYNPVGVRPNGRVTEQVLLSQDHESVDCGFTKNDKIVIEVNQPETCIKLWKNDICIYRYTKGCDDIMRYFDFYCKIENSKDQNMFKHIKYYVECPDVVKQDDKYQTNQKLLHVSADLESVTETIKDLDQDEDTRTWGYYGRDFGNMQLLFNIQRLIHQTEAHDAKVSSLEWEKFDTCLKDLDEEILSRMIDNLSNIKSKIGDLRNDREIKKRDPEYYQDWSIEDVGNWIDTIENGKFSDYSQQLKDGMQKHGLTAADIKDINQLGLKLLGVANYNQEERKYLAQYLQNIENKQDKNVHYEEYVVQDEVR